MLLAAGVCIRLGFWQLSRLEERRARNHAIQVANGLPVLSLDSAAAAAIERNPAAFVHRRVTARGVYLPAGEVVLRGRALEGRPGVHLATPLRLEGSGAIVMVERGWAPSPDALSVDARSLAEPGARGVEGVLQPISSSGEPGTAVRGTSVRLDFSELRRGIPGRLLPLRIQQLAPEPAVPGLRRIPPPDPDEGPHLGYAIQWFSFAAIALIGFGVVVRKRTG